MQMRDKLPAVWETAINPNWFEEIRHPEMQGEDGGRLARSYALLQTSVEMNDRRVRKDKVPRIAIREFISRVATFDVRFVRLVCGIKLVISRLASACFMIADSNSQFE